MWKKLIGAIAAIALSTALAAAQTNPGLTQGQKLTPAQWNNLFASKQDTLGYTPLNQAGGSMSGRLVTAAPGASTAGFNLTPGTTPGSPSDGDLWVTSTSAYARVNGVTYDLLSPASSGLVVGTSTITSGTNARVLYDNSGVLGEYPVIGSGSVIMSELGGSGALTTFTSSLIGGDKAFAINAFSSGSGGAFAEICKPSPGAGKLCFLTLNGPASGSGGGAFIQADYNGLLGWGIGNYSSIAGGAFDFTTSVVSARDLRFIIGSGGTTPVVNTFGGLWFSNLTTGGVTTIANVAAGQPLVSAGTSASAPPAYTGVWANFDTANTRLILRRVSSTFPAPGSTTSIFVQGGNTGEGRIDIGAANSDSVVGCLRVNNTWASPQVVAAGEQICGWTGASIDTNGSTTAQQGGFIGGFALNTWSISDHSFYWDIGTIAGGSTSLVTTARFSAAGGLSVGPSPGNAASGIINAVSGFTTLGTYAGTVQNANALAVGRQGTTNPALQVDSSSATSVTGIKVLGNPSGQGGQISVISSATNENLLIDAKGTGTISLGGAISTGRVNVYVPIGYGSSIGVGGTVTQGTSRTTGVTLDKVAGAITLFSTTNTAVSGATAQSFTVTNNTVAATDQILVEQKSGTDKYLIFVTNVQAGSFQITNYTTGGTTNEAPVFTFTVFKSTAN